MPAIALMIQAYCQIGGIVSRYDEKRFASIVM